MLRSVVGIIRGPLVGIRSVATETSTIKGWTRISRGPNVPPPVAREDMPFLHHGKRPRFKGYEKFKSPRKRASKLYMELQKEAIEKSKASRPGVWNTKINVGDAIEIEMVEEGGVNSNKLERFRGVVLGIFRRGLGHSVAIRDVIMGEAVDTQIPLHSPMLRSVTVLRRNFAYNGKKRARRNKLFHHADKGYINTTVSGVKFEKDLLKAKGKKDKKDKKKKKKKKKQ